MFLGLKQPTADRLKQLIAQATDVDSERGRGGVHRPAAILVQCLSNVPAASTGVGAQCYSANILNLHANLTTQPTIGDVWLTCLLGLSQTQIPTPGAIYEAIMSATFDPGSDLRPRVFSVANTATTTYKYKCQNGVNVEYVSYDGGQTWAFSSFQGCCACGSTGSTGSIGSGSQGSAPSPCCGYGTTTLSIPTLYVKIPAGCFGGCAGQVITLNGGTNSSGAIWDSNTFTCADGTRILFTITCSTQSGSQLWTWHVENQTTGCVFQGASTGSDGVVTITCGLPFCMTLNLAAYANEFCPQCPTPPTFVITSNPSGVCSGSSGSTGSSGSGGSGGSASGSGSGSAPTPCCFPAPNTLTGSVSNQTGATGGIPSTWPMALSSSNGSTFEEWAASFGAVFGQLWCATSGANDNTVKLVCTNGVWTLTDDDAEISATLVTAQCSPFLVVFNVTLSGPCGGTFTVTFTTP